MKKILVLALLILILPVTSAYYADINIDVEDTGLVSIEGETNHPTLLIEDSHEFTSKNGRYWVLNVSPEGEFSTMIYSLDLPKNAVVNYMKLPKLGRIEDNKGRISIIGTAQDQDVEIIVQYEILVFGVSWKWLYFVIGILLILFGFWLNYWKKSKKRVSLYGLTSRQRKIVKLLKKGVKTQAELERRTGLPKSSLSRNIDSLVRKEIVVKEQQGMTNILRLK